jgi:tight adherence protein B
MPAAVSVLVLVTLVAGRAAARTHRRAGTGFGAAALSAARRPRSVVKAPPGVALRFAEAGLDVNPDHPWSAWLATSVGATILALPAGGPGLVVVVVALSAAAPIVAWSLCRHRGQARVEAALPGAVDAIARGLRSGASLRQAVAEAATATPGELGRDLAHVAAATERGATIGDSLGEWARHRPLVGVRLVVAALSLASEMGGATARAVDGVADTLRQRLAARAEARALATQARASAAVIAAAPLAFCALASATDRRTLAFVFGTAPGLAFLTAGLALDAAGALWMARITRIEP